MHIHGTSHVHGPHGINGPHFGNRAPASHAAPPSDGADRVEISPAAQEVIRIAESKLVRQELVDSIRAQIASGTYDTPAKLEAALERMLDEIA